MPPSNKSAASSKKSAVPNLNARIKKLKGSDGLSALKWAKDRADDHVVHTSMGNVTLFEKFGLRSLSKLSDDDLIEAIDFYTLARNQYLAFLSGSTAR